MPANLPPNYFEAEKRYRTAKSAEAKMEALEEMLTIMPKHKGTDKLRADLRRRIAKVKEQAQKKGAAKRETEYFIEKEGAAQVVLVGAPNVGKSSLVASLTNARPEVADFPHSTWKPTPGMIHYENIQFQLVDTPPVTREYVDPWMVDLLRRADILILVVDLLADSLQQLEDTLSVLESLRIFPEKGEIPGGVVKKPFRKKMLVLANKMDEGEDDFEAFLELSGTQLPAAGASTLTGRNLSDLVKKLYEMSDVIRVYTKAPGKEPNFEAPFTMAKESTLEELAAKIHKDFAEKMKFAKIWGGSAFAGQMVQRDYVLQEGDIVEIHL